MTTLTKTLKKMSGLKAGVGFLYMMTYREKFSLAVDEDEVIVMLKKANVPR